MRYFLFCGERCAPCTAAKKELESIVEIEMLDVTTDMHLALRCGIRSVPTLVAATIDGKPLLTYSGKITLREVRRWIAKLESAS